MILFSKSTCDLVELLLIDFSICWYINTISNYSWKRTISCHVYLVFQLSVMLLVQGALNFFSDRGVRPGFPKCGAWELLFDSEKGGGGLWTENFQIWGLVNWKFPNLGACELKISKFGGLTAKIWAKIEAVEAKISKFSQKGVLWTDSFAWNGTLVNCRGGVKRGSSGPHILIPPF